MDSQLLEQQIIAQYSDPTVTRYQSHGNAYRFLLRPENREHWWCQHYDLTKELSEVLLHQDQAQPRHIWQTMAQQMGGCSQCISHYHQMQVELLSGQYELAVVRPLLEVLWQLDKERLLAWLGEELQEPSSQLVLALFEVLGYAYYLDDYQICSAVIQQLNNLDWQIATDGESRFTGFYKLLAHPDAPVRAKAQEFVNQIGPFSLQDLEDTNMSVVLLPWLDGLQWQLTGSVLADNQVVMQSQLIPPADRQRWPPVNIWFGLKVLLGLLESDCIPSILSKYSRILILIVSQACPAAGWIPQQEQQPPRLGAQPADLAAEGSMEHKHALGCLHIMLKSCKQELWNCVPGVFLSELVHQLQAICWRRTADAGLLKLLVQVLQAIVTSLLPHLLIADGEADAELNGAASSEASAHDPDDRFTASDAKLAVGRCLRMLLVQLPGSSAMPLLIRGLALQAGIDCCIAALQSPSCPGTGTFSHLWGPVCADVLYLPSDQQQSPWGDAAGGYKQHQAPGLLKLIPLLNQMDELRRKVVGAAADLVALALQVDAAVLQAALDSSNTSRPANKYSLVPGALDTIEVALNHAADFMCSPSLWLALAGCGHSTVSATYTSVAAQLAPLTGMAARRLASTGMGASVQQQLDRSLVLPNPETVELDSTQHVLYALDHAGWLHAQLLKATVRHMHTCSVRSRFFILPRSQRPSSGLRSARGTQPTINALYQQLADSQALPPDSVAVEPYGLVVSSCCSLLLLGSGGPAAAVTAGAELALLSSFGVGVGELDVAVKQQLLAPGSVGAALVVEAMLEAVQKVQSQKLQQVIAKQPQRLIAILQFTQYSLSAANHSGLDVMLPSLASYIPEAWQFMVDCLSCGAKLLTACKQCMAGAADSRPGSGQAVSGSDSHTGPAVISVLKVLMECLPLMWQCHQVLLEQRFEQRRLYMLSLDSPYAEDEDVLLSPSESQGWLGASQGAGSRPTSAVGDRATKMLHLEIQREMKWMVQLLQLGQQLFCEDSSSSSSSSSSSCSQCCRTAATSKDFVQAWKAAVEGAVKLTTAPLSKAVKAAAGELMSAETLLLDKLWLARLFPSAAPGNLGSCGLGCWPHRLLSANGVAGTGEKPAAVAAAPAVKSAGTSAAAVEDVIVIESDDNDEWVGEWLSDDEPASNHSTDKEGQISSEDHDDQPMEGTGQVVILDDSEEGEEHHQQQADSPQQLLHRWPWLKQQVQQQKQHQDAVITGATKLLQSSKTLNAAKKHQQQEGRVTPSLFDSLADSRTARRRGTQPSDDQFKALLASLDQATFKAQQQPAAKPEVQQQAPGAAQGSKAPQGSAPAAAEEKEEVSAVNHLLKSTRTAGKHKEQQPSPASGLQKAHRANQQAAKVESKQQQPQRSQSRQQQKVKSNVKSVDVESLWPAAWPADHQDSSRFHPTGDAGGGSSRGWGVSKFNVGSGGRTRQKQQVQNFAGLSKADQLRAELLGRPIVGNDQAAAAASSRGGAGTDQDRLMSFINEQIQKHAGAQQQQVVKHNRDAVDATMPPPLQHQRQQAKQRERQRRLFLEQRERERKERERLEQERKEKQQQEQQVLKQQLEARRAQEQRQAMAAKQADAAAAGTASVNLISDDALFAQASAANKASSKLSASLQQKHHNVVTLKGGALVNSNRRYDSLLRPTHVQAPGSRLLGGPRGPQAVVVGNRYFPPLRLDEVVAELLSWGYLGAVGAQSSTSDAAALRKSLLDASGKVPLKFFSRSHYCHVFKGLLLEELRAGLAASYEELVTTGGASKREAAGSGGFKCLPLMIDSVQRQSNVHVINARVDTNSLHSWERDSPRTEDFILITKIQLTSAAQLAADKLPRSHLTGFVIDASAEQPGVRLVTFKVCTASAGSEVMSNYWQQLLVVRAQLWCSVVTSLVPNFREFQALAALQQSPAGHRLFSQVLSPQPPSTPPPTALSTTPTAASNNRAVTSITSGLSAALVSAYNHSQQSAVAACLDKRWPFVLVQGPPGTGKTSAIIGILSALLAAKQGEAEAAAAAAGTKGRKVPSRHSKSAHSAGMLNPAAAQEALQLGVIPPVRILVCAQSNAAIDELATRLANEGVWGENGDKRAPAMVRLGRSDATHPSVLMFHVDALADNKVAQQQQQHQVQQQHQRTERDSLQQRVKDLKEQLQQVEEHLAALFNRGKASVSAVNTTAAASKEVSSGKREGQQRQVVQKRAREDAGVTAAAVVEPRRGSESHVAKKQKITDRDPATTDAGNTTTSAVARSGDLHSSRDMDVSDGGGPAAEKYKRQQPRAEDSRQVTGSKERSSSRSRDRNRDNSWDRHRDRHRSTRRGSSTERRTRSSSRERRGSAEDSQHSRRSRNRRSSRERDPRESRHSTRRRSRSSSRSRHRGRDRSSSRGRHSKSPSRHESHSRQHDGLRAPQTETHNKAQPGQQQAVAGPLGTEDTDKREQQQQQLPMNAAVSESLLRDQQRSLLASLRTVELELQKRAASGGGRELERAKRSARQAVIIAAEIVMCTLSAAGGDLLHCFPAGAEAPLFDVLVVDEAAQALEPATLIPMQMLKPGTGRVVLVGDPCQLPPTVLSRAAEAALLAQSLFERLARAGWPVTLLREQYRMHPLISAFPSRFFYDGQLVDGAGISAVSKGAKFHSRLVFSPFVMWDCWEGKEARGAAGAGGSLRNAAEAQLAAALVAGVLQSYRGEVGSIAVISPYKAQVSALRHEFRRALGGDAALTAANIEFGTVDGFQGREADIVVFSCVRAQPEATLAAGSLTPRLDATPNSADTSGGGSGGAGGAGGVGPRVGFLADVRRMNVGLTRGRRAVWVVCHAGTLAASRAWRPLLQEARSRGVLLEARAPFNRLMGAADKQLRGSYFTPDAAVAVADAEQSVPAASTGGGGGSGVVDPGVSGHIGMAQQSAPATAAPERVRPMKQRPGEPTATAVCGTIGSQKGGKAAEAGSIEVAHAPAEKRGLRPPPQRQQQLPAASPPQTGIMATGAVKKARQPVSLQQGSAPASGNGKQGAAAENKLRAAHQQRLQKQKLEKDKQATQLQHLQQSSDAAVSKISSQQPAVLDRRTAAGTHLAGVRSGTSSHPGSAAAAAGKSIERKPPNSAAAAAAAARTGAGSGSSNFTGQHKGQQRGHQRAINSAGNLQPAKSTQTTAGAGDDNLKAALLRRIQQQRQQQQQQRN